MRRRRRMALAGVAAMGLLSAAQTGALIDYILSMDDGAASGATLEGLRGLPGVDELDGLTDLPGLDDLAHLSGLSLGGSAPASAERTTAAYQDHGAWVDVFDYVPAMHEPGTDPPVTPADVDEMAENGVRTLYLQAAHEHAATPDLLVDEDLLAAFLARAHRHDMRVVGWYLPRFRDLDRDLDHLDAIATFRVGAHRFDGVAVDIEWTEGVPDHKERSARLVELSTRFHDLVGDDALGAIVLPPVQIEEVNPDFWPRFPWRKLAPLYDAWLPMGYWTDRRVDSGYRDAFTYTVENVGRLRARLGDPGAVVHAIGGIGDKTTPKDITRFARSLEEVGAVGGSIYDWNTLGPPRRAQLADELSGG